MKDSTEKFTVKAWIHLTEVTATHGEVNIKQIVFVQTLVPAETQYIQILLSSSTAYWLVHFI